MESHQQEYTSMIMADSRNMSIKGKRTKRTRPPSPLTLTMASTSSTTTTTGASEDNDAENPDITFTPTIEFSKIVNQENDEEDMANCLILLAQGQQQSSPPPPPHRQKAAALLEVERTSKLCVYACKTCNRGFSSFQALGGHRASHKKPSNSKPHLEDRSRIPNMMKQDCGSTTLSLQIGLNPRTSQCNHSGSMKVAKIHDCSICGAEFGSGQALGGHMRRHRSMPMATTSCGGDASRNQEYKKPKTLLSLDLNLPASDEDDHREITKLPFRQKDQMIVFSNSSLVHCHL